MGDLIVTCSSAKSRNYQVGFALGQGLSLEDAVARLGEVAGVNTIKVLKARAQALEGVHAFGHRSACDSVRGAYADSKVIELLIAAGKNRCRLHFY